MSGRTNEIPLFSAEELSYPKFCELMSANRPCRISGITTDWRASQEWVVDARVNVEQVRKIFGDSIVPVADCHRSEYGSQPKREMTMSSYLEYWESYKRPEIDERCWGNINHEGCVYLKDWHMQRNFPLYEAYVVPEYFESDWLNEFWLAGDKQDDYRFVYIGPQGSWTPLHSDVFGSFSWSANICGEKLWLFLPPGDEEYLKDVNGKLAPDMTHIPSPHLYPKLNERKEPIRIVQKAGETIFVPSGWHHQVLNIRDTISINHNWFNGFNLELVVKHLENAEIEVKKELSFMESDETFADQVEIVLKAHHGMNRKDFQELLNFIAGERMKKSNGKHVIFDLCQCSKFLENPLLRDEITTLVAKRSSPKVPPQ